jgi:hypothetical protein
MARIRGLVALRGLARLPERLDALNQRLAEAPAALHDAREDPDTLRSRPDGIAEMSRTAELWSAELRSQEAKPLHHHGPQPTAAPRPPGFWSPIR